ncbi:hypothetical protein QUF84_09085 [Fictibacillus enclensis]|uniref:hypothetical protein n=1 Tax=Fictibacillus enclensis TaxID=1017270 RepID=UPI0025A25453|nr:hypothetical protein [Fictibacillus enclensis]MDM5337367.1 hypothetical protein [Fictibacillus enclensis]
MNEITLTKTKWNFPDNNGGSVDGLNDSGIETFNGNIYESLAREIIQNSIDARLNENEAVRVDFNLKYISSDLFPEKSSYIDIIERCKEFWETNKKTTKFFSNALSILNKKSIPLLKISDYNTTGLTGSLKDDNDSNWFGLIKSTGNSNKDGGSGGSFGIGKNAPFACSELRTVFYSTLDQHSISAFQGVGKLVTHISDNRKTRGTGYFGNPEDNQPISWRQLEQSYFYNNIYSRDQVGTDIFVFGFKVEDNWKNKMIRSILENFTVALYKGMLEVEVDGVLLSQSNLHQRVKEFSLNIKNPLSLLYYRALTQGEYFPKKGFEYSSHYDGLELYLLEGKDLPKQVAMFRKMGMKIFDKKHFRGATNFIGVLFVSGKDTNEKLREMEPAAHDKWEASRARDSFDNPEKYLKGINEWIKKCVSSLVDYSDNEEIDFSGAGDYLPLEYDEPVGGFIKKKEVFPKESKEEKVDIKRNRKVKEKVNERMDGEIDNETGEQGPKGDNDSQTSGGEDQRSGNQGEGNGSGQEGGSTSNFIASNKPLKAQTQRAFFLEEEKAYHITIYSNVSKAGFLAASIAGEASNEKYKIIKAIDSTGFQLNVNEGETVGPINFEKNKSKTIKIYLEKSIRAALDINLKEGVRVQ